VDLDPTDAEAWLILGSAQQDSGHWKEGREAYTECTKQAKVGPIGECRMMLR
jgi:cytochrome c-type biogenesis protein CcmH/NrfG